MENRESEIAKKKVWYRESIKECEKVKKYKVWEKLRAKKVWKKDSIANITNMILMFQNLFCTNILIRATF